MGRQVHGGLQLCEERPQETHGSEGSKEETKTREKESQEASEAKEREDSTRATRESHTRTAMMSRRCCMVYYNSVNLCVFVLLYKTLHQRDNAILVLIIVK